MTRIPAHPRFSPLLLLSALAVALLAPASAFGVSVEQIPSPRPSGWTVDLTGTLPAPAIADLNRLGDQVKAQTGGEMAFVVVGTIDGAGSHEFATRLANHWGIGDARRNDGILVFVALDDRTAEIVLGTGVDGPEQVRAAESIMQEEMVPRFRKNDPAGAMYQGGLGCARRILGFTPAAAPGFSSEVPQGPAREPAPVAAPQPLARPGTASPAERVDTGKAVGIGAIFTLLASFIVPRVLRHRARRCPKCKGKMVRLDESADDAHLNEQERTEERIRSQDYDIWVCEPCGEATKLQYNRFFSGYSRCPQCGAKTRSQTSTTLVAATYDHGGTVRVDEQCAHCSYQSTSTHHTPRRQRPRSSSGSGGRSSGFGGGRSAGRGASGRW